MVSAPGGPGDDGEGGAGAEEPQGARVAVDWEVAHRMASWVAVQDAPDVGTSSDERRQIEELGRVAELHVAAATGLSPSAGGHPIRVVGVSRNEWVVRELARHRRLLETLASALALSEEGEGGEDPPSRSPDEADDSAETAPELDMAADPLARLARVPPPVARGFVFGWMFGHLAQRSLGQYDLPLPGPTEDELVVVPANLSSFASEWGLPADEVRLWVCLRDVAHHAVLDRPHVRARVESLLRQYVSAFDVDPGAFAGQLEELDVTDRASFQHVFGEPERVLETVRSERQRQLLPWIEAVTAVVAGYVDHVMDRVGPSLLPSYAALSEAMSRWRVEASWGDRYVAKLLGLETRQVAHDRGVAFVRGVVERAGDIALSRLWDTERTLPTPAEVDAPGLWLARIDLADDATD